MRATSVGVGIKIRLFVEGFGEKILTKVYVWGYLEHINL